ncbi:organ-specific protein S2-like [Arachis duranensis]|uniref:Organ-specific protein S2-like n=1 Tax=Arachis duranensis TaxID=130453 RepID=A0A9C6WR42_ARADU|nr:organ-specific protein S2-like [Arachis duranensis]
MMTKPTTLAFLSLLFFVLFVAAVESRKEPGMVEGFQSLLQVKVENKPNSQEILLDEGPNNKQKCEEKKVMIMEKEMILEDFEPSSSITTNNNDNIHFKLKNIEFEPRPSATAYNNDNIHATLKNSEFEPKTKYNCLQQ